LAGIISKRGEANISNIITNRGTKVVRAHRVGYWYHRPPLNIRGGTRARPVMSIPIQLCL